MKLPNYFHSNIKLDIDRLISEKPTPFLVLDISVIEQRYREMVEGFPLADVFYAVKANPADSIIQRLMELGSNFDIASVQELHKVLALNVDSKRIAFGNTIKKKADIALFYHHGVRLFATDCEEDLNNIATAAPGSDVYIRLLFDGSSSADWPLSDKFGCKENMAVELAAKAKALGLNPYGVSFHVGSQQRDIDTWRQAILATKSIFDEVQEKHNISLQMINLGGGLPASYIQQTDDFPTYANSIQSFIKQSFPQGAPRIVIEPGRSLVGDAGIIVSEVVLVTDKETKANTTDRWVYTDVGTFNGLIETLGEAIKYPLMTNKHGDNNDVILAGPTCDSMDIMYQEHKYSLPSNLSIGDNLFWLSTGAYTTSYSSIEFNGFPPLVCYLVGD